MGLGGSRTARSPHKVVGRPGGATLVTWITDKPPAMWYTPPVLPHSRGVYYDQEGQSQ